MTYKDIQGLEKYADHRHAFETIDGVEASSYYNNDGSYEIVIDYHYKNLGYEAQNGDGLLIAFVDFTVSSSTTVIDEKGIVASGSTMALGLVNPQYATVGASWSAQAKFHIMSPVKTATLEYSLRDGDGVEQPAIFDLSW